ncbi:MAG: cytochrome c peroxidase [Sandaracinaceae bacterium]
MVVRTTLAEAGVYSPVRNTLGDEAEVHLGQILFFDPKLSGNRNIACATCHLPGFHAVDGQPLGRGQGGVGTGPARAGGPTLPRAVIAPFNRSFVTAFLWDGRVEDLPDGTIRAPVPLPDGLEGAMEAQVLMPLLDRDEMRGQLGDNDLADLSDDHPAAIWNAIVARLLAFDDYVQLFEDAYPGETPTIVHVSRAIVAFERQIWDITDTAFDQFLTPNPFDDAGPTDPLALTGMELFFGDAGCARCHGGPLLSDMEFHNIGVPQLGPGKDPSTGLDEGRALVTGNPADRFAFRTPPLRNVALTAPYMHDGAYWSLEDAIRHHLSPEEHLRSYALPSGSPGELHADPATLDAILATLDQNITPHRELDEFDVSALAAFLQSLTSFTELRLDPAIGIPRSLPSGLPPPSPF